MGFWSAILGIDKERISGLATRIFELEHNLEVLSTSLKKLRSSIGGSAQRNYQSMEENEIKSKPSNADAAFFKAYPAARANADFARSSFEYRNFVEGYSQQQMDNYNNDEDDDEEEE